MAHGTSQPRATGTARTGTPQLPRTLVTLLAVSCGLTVANMYYAQPLLDTIARELHVSSGAAGLTVTVSQLGFALGLALLVPLGDLVKRHRLVVGTLAVEVVALLAVAAAPNLPLLCAALAVVGVTSVAAQILVPFAASLAAPEERGRVVGTVMSGLLLGILLARTLSGLLASVLGWRAVYVVAAVLIAVLAAVLHVRLPRVPATTGVSYPALLRSVGSLVREHPVLRRRMAYGALFFGVFSVFWTAIAFLLAAEPYSYGEATIGLFGLVGVVGALCAQASGRLVDRGHVLAGTGVYVAMTAVSFGVLSFGRTSLTALVLGVVLLDAGVQGTHILNQGSIYALDAQARSRLTTAYMVANFLGGSIGSAASAVMWGAHGWLGVCALGGAASAVAMALWLGELVGSLRTRQTSTR